MSQQDPPRDQAGGSPSGRYLMQGWEPSEAPGTARTRRLPGSGTGSLRRDAPDGAALVRGSQRNEAKIVGPRRHTIFRHRLLAAALGCLVLPAMAIACCASLLWEAWWHTDATVSWLQSGVALLLALLGFALLALLAAACSRSIGSALQGGIAWSGLAMLSLCAWARWGDPGTAPVELRLAMVAWNPLHAAWHQDLDQRGAALRDELRAIHQDRDTRMQQLQEDQAAALADVQSSHVSALAELRDERDTARKAAVAQLATVGRLQEALQALEASSSAAQAARLTAEQAAGRLRQERDLAREALAESSEQSSAEIEALRGTIRALQNATSPPTATAPLADDPGVMTEAELDAELEARAATRP